MSERKRANASVQEQPSFMAKAKKFRIPIVIIVVWMAIVAYQVGAQRGAIGDPGSGCPGHWHYMLDVQVDGEELTFDPNVNRGFSDAGQTGFHLHDATGRVHMHPGTERCINFSETTEFLGVDVAPGAVTIASLNYLTTQDVAGTHADNETHELRVYHADWDYGTDSRGDWTRITNIGAFVDDQMGNGDAVLVTYVPKNISNEEIAAQQDGVGFIGDSYIPAAKTIFVPIMAATLFAGLGLVFWNKFRQAA